MFEILLFVVSNLKMTVLRHPQRRLLVGDNPRIPETELSQMDLRVTARIARITT